MINVNGITWTKAGRTDRQIDDSTDDNIPSASRPRGRKGQCWYQTHLRFWCAEKLLNSAGYSWGVIVFTRWFDLGLAWKLIKVRQCQHWTHLRICCGKHTCKVTTWCMQFLRSYLIYKGQCQSHPRFQCGVCNSWWAIVLNKSLNFVFQQINPTGVVQKLFNIDVSTLKPFSRYIRHALQNHIEHSK